MSEMMDIVKQVNENVAQHVEEFAAAFAKRTGLDPTKIKMVSSIRGYRHEVWFEPFPSITEIEQYRKRAELAEAELARRDEQIEKLEDALHKISNWCKAYPLEIADEPTEDEWKTAHAIMNQHGWSLTAFVVSGMRRVTNGIAEIADLGG